MQQVFNIVLIVLAALLVVTIVLQQRGSGLGEAFGGEGGIHTTKRGADRVLYIATIIVAVIFFGVALLNIIMG